MNSDEILARLVDSVEHLAGRQTVLENQLARRGQLVGFDHDPEDVPEPVIPRRRELVEDPAQREQMDRELHAWVNWLLNRYRLALKIPACWHQHGQLVEELTALWYAWRAAWITPASGWDPTRWHHDLAAMLQRITSTYPATCGLACHGLNAPSLGRQDYLHESATRRRS
jgi:hypothetical protein